MIYMERRHSNSLLRFIRKNKSDKKPSDKKPTHVQHEPLDHILKDKVLKDLFQEWATQNLCVEFLMFYFEVHIHFIFIEKHLNF